jgi:hypothetical protein
MQKLTFVLLGALAACGNSPGATDAHTHGPDHHATPTPTVAATPDAAAPAMGHHDAPHGGVVKMHAADGVHLHVEVVVKADGTVRLYPSDAQGKAIALAEASGKVSCEHGGKKTDVDAKPDSADGALVAQCPALAPPEVAVTFDVTMRGVRWDRTLKVGPGGTSDTSHAH